MQMYIISSATRLQKNDYICIMGKEIEHKYIVKDSSYIELSQESYRIRQGYLSRVPERTVRIRTLDLRGFITVKGKNHGDIREEYEYEIPYEDALSMLYICEGTVIDKTRYIVIWDGHKWEIDEFHNSSLTGLITAEIELKSSEEDYSLPPFVGENVTGDPKYYNSNLTK